VPLRKAKCRRYGQPSRTQKSTSLKTVISLQGERVRKEGCGERIKRCATLRPECMRMEEDRKTVLPLDKRPRGKELAPEYTKLQLKKVSR